MVALILIAFLHASRPNPQLTPGVARPLTQVQVCDTKWGRDRRYVTVRMKKHVAASYGVPWTHVKKYEFDHLIPRELGGADDILNLWPQPWAGARKKDVLENELHRHVCAGSLTLSEAQQMIQKDWVAAYYKVVDER